MTIDQKPLNKVVPRKRSTKKAARHLATARNLAPFDLNSLLLSPKAELSSQSRSLTLGRHAQPALARPVCRPSPCLLSTFDNPKRLGVIPGLDWIDGAIELSRQKWGCCQGTASQYMADSNCTFRCDLKQRLLVLEQLIQYIRAHFPDADLMEILAPNKFSPVLDQLSLIAQKKSSQGMVFIRRSQGTVLSRFFWATALAAHWRFGLDFKLRDLNHPTAFFFGRKNLVVEENLFMVYNVTDLWSPKTFEYLDYVVSYAYNGCIPLFIEFILEAFPNDESSHEGKVALTNESFGDGSTQVKASGIQSAKLGFKSRITAARKKTLRTTYPPSFLRKLRTVALGLPGGIFD